MIFDPGVINAAKAHGVFVEDFNKNGHIDANDLNEAIQYKALAPKIHVLAKSNVVSSGAETEVK